jgi:hypothetical protein
MRRVTTRSSGGPSYPLAKLMAMASIAMLAAFTSGSPAIAAEASARRGRFIRAPKPADAAPPIPLRIASGFPVLVPPMLEPAEAEPAEAEQAEAEQAKAEPEELGPAPQRPLRAEPRAIRAPLLVGPSNSPTSDVPKVRVPLRASPAWERYPKFQGGFHSRQLYDLGVPTGDRGLRGNSFSIYPW